MATLRRPARRSGDSARRISTVSARRTRDTPTARSPPTGPGLGPRFLVDTSVWSRLATSSRVTDALRALVNTSSPIAIHICPPIVLEYAYSARSGPGHTDLVQRLAEFPDCPIAPSSQDVLQIQNALWNGGLLRAVGAMDTLIAAYAVANAATVVHYDSDFEHIAAVAPAFRHHWIAPRGSL